MHRKIADSIKGCFTLAYYSRCMSYKEVRMLTPLEYDVIIQQLEHINEERNKEMKKK